MAYIPPTSVIQVYKGLPLYPDYENTVIFTSLSAQNTYFSAVAYATFQNTSYQRINKNTLKLQGNIEMLYNINYMRFQNTNFENKWFYAFVTKVDYINNETVEITYELDYMQTWLWSIDYSFEPCFIERQHAESDKFFEHLEPENVDLGPEYIGNGSMNYGLCPRDELYVGFLVSRSPDGVKTTGSRVGNMYSGLLFHGNTVADAINYIQRYNSAAVQVPTVASPEDIVVIYMYPSSFGSGDLDLMPPIWQPNDWHIADVNDPHFLRDIDGYVPKNKKLFNAPYQCLDIYNGDNTSKTYKWEQWMQGYTLSNDRATTIGYLGYFRLRGTLFPPVSAICYPIDYGGQLEPFDDGVTIENFPQCAWNSDVFKAWWAQNKATTAVNLMSAGIRTGISAGVGSLNANALSSAQTGVSWQRTQTGVINQMAYTGGNFIETAAKTVAQMEDLKAASPNVHGTISSESLRTQMGRYDFTARWKSIRHEYAKKIDDYFTMYGYAKNAIAFPNILARERWTYLKTKNCQILGDMTSEIAETICSIYNKGIRIWKDISEIGQYSLTNNPIYM